MIEPARFFDAVSAAGVRFAAGVPDSLLKEACTYLAEALPPERHVIAVNEGSAIALAVGHFLATGAVPLVYLQNSGLGNAVNPLLSLAAPSVYAVPLVLLIGWRGEPGVPDEPQHVTQGRLTPALLDALELPYRVLDGDPEAASVHVRWAVVEARRRSGPVALLVRKGAFLALPRVVERAPAAAVRHERLTREDAIERIVRALLPETTVVATTGMISRELYAIRRRLGDDGSRDFLTVGSMGHASQIALGLALARPGMPVACLDGDAAALMHMGGLATVGTSAATGYLHVVLNNGAHDSVGGQPSAGFAIDLPGIARACGYEVALGPVRDAVAVTEQVRALQASRGPNLLEVRVATGARPDLGRPAEAPVDNKRCFMRRLGLSVDV